MDEGYLAVRILVDDRVFAAALELAETPNTAEIVIERTGAGPAEPTNEDLGYAASLVGALQKLRRQYFWDVAQ